MRVSELASGNAASRRGLRAVEWCSVTLLTNF